MKSVSYRVPLSLKVQEDISHAEWWERFYDDLKIGVLERGKTGRRRWVNYSQAFKDFANKNGLSIFVGPGTAFTRPRGDPEMKLAVQKWKERHI